MLYLDSSAIVKLVQQERESATLLAYLEQHAASALLASMLARVEVMRAAYFAGAAAVIRAANVLATFQQVAVHPQLLDDAGNLLPGRLRSLDAIHLATARLFAGQLVAVITYDRRLAEGARTLNLPVATPGSVA
ncbi:MAG: type II toxin-antitoxin system VapC family toxin [Candidatus Dormibacteraeota bacterium]|uniref:Type II toxin-antitoxin system VapC family toxin n=1 Tax=Candidatus Dormiibacter inghamiae TaxID=3127013 RepID=A0A934KI05_9BACT|nr:type II toxin-antitoxin system VapC family toxin [Candidatus Dormibacteraeota bacterium]MBJ7607646.1 type II toxin-antitoxin system VapC family toxin [Candidatus Dormibacteraeota bacterium]